MKQTVTSPGLVPFFAHYHGPGWIEEKFDPEISTRWHTSITMLIDCGFEYVDNDKLEGFILLIISNKKYKWYFLEQLKTNNII